MHGATACERAPRWHGPVDRYRRKEPENEGLIEFVATLRVSTFRNLLLADVVADVGAFMQSVGAAWLRVSLGAGPIYVALTQTAASLPSFLLALPAGSAGDIFDRRKLSALGLRRDPHGSVKQIHHEELEDGDKERPSAFPKIMLKQTDSGIQQLHGAGERTQDQQRRRRLLVDRPQCEQSQRNCARRRVHRQ